MHSSQSITKNDLVQMLDAIALRIQEQSEELSRLDTEIGDGDHGFSMATGFSSLAGKLDEFSQLPIGGLLKKAGFE